MLRAYFFIWKSTGKKLKKFFNEISKKHTFIKLDQKYSKSEIQYLEVLDYKDEQQKLIQNQLSALNPSKSLEKMFSS